MTATSSITAQDLKIFGTDHDTGSFAVESIRRWCLHIGSENFKYANKIMIVCDSGGGNGWKPKLWKCQLAMPAEEIHKELHVYHMPSGASKWNKIEHSLFCYLTRNREEKKSAGYQDSCELRK